MKIVSDNNQLFKYAFVFDFDPLVVDFCRNLKDVKGWREFNYMDGSWRFNDMGVALEIKNKYPYCEISDDISIDYGFAQITYEENQKRELNADRIKNATESNIVIDGINGELYPYQKVGVEFFMNSGGRVILADQMGCIAGDQEIIVNRGGNGRRYKLRDLYKKSIKTFDPLIPSMTRSLTTDGYLKLNIIKKIISSGIKNTICINAITEDNKKYSIRLTEDHELLSEYGKWVKSINLDIGDYIQVNGTHQKWCKICKECTDHHKNGIKNDNRLNNLELLTIKEHLFKERKSKGFKNFKEFIMPNMAKITSIKKTGKIDVYDLVMDNPNRNFVVNGVIVHNCGKSVQTLAYSVYSKKKKPLIICPASVKRSWYDEVEKWTNLKALIVDSKTDKKMFNIDYYDIFIINYDIIPKFLKEILAGNFDIAIVDEFTYIKNSKARRTKCVKLICKKIPSVLLLSGTPMLSRPVELFNGLNIIDPKTWNDYIGYTKLFCQGHQGRWGWDANGASNLDELQKRISKYFIRRTKDQVLPGLPEKIFINRPVDLDKEYQDKYKFALNEFGRFLRDVKKKKSPEIMKSLQAEKLVKLGELRQLTTLGKVSSAEDIINEVLENDEKMLVFSVYNEPLERLYDKFKDKAVMLTGKTKEGDRYDAIDKFQKDDNIKIFFGGTLSAGMGITLTAATNVLFLDYAWNPSQMAQSIDRIHRPGNNAARVNIYNLYAVGTIDEYMTKLLKRKQLLFDKIIEGSNKRVRSSSKSIINDVLKMVEKNVLAPS